MMHPTQRRERFRAILAGQECVFPASVFDPLSARAAEDLGFELTMLAGSIASMTVLGDPDLCVITLSEFADQIRRISRAAATPLLVDADHGYGNALSVRRTVEEVEAAGAAALTIEDTLLPKAFGQEGTQLISIEEGVGKMRAAIQARQDPSLSIIGRTSAISISGIDDALARISAYEAAGVDALFVTGLTDRAQLDAVAQTIRLPIILGAAPADVKDPDYLRSRNVKVALVGHQPFLSAVEAAYSTLQQLRAGTAPKALTGVASPERMQQLTRKQQFSQWSGEFLTKPQK